MDIRLIAVDLDGTLLRHDSTLCPQGATALKAAEDMGVAVVICTTRVPHSALHFAREVGLHSPVICTNGAEVFESFAGETWCKHSLDAEIALDLTSYADVQGWSLITTTDDVTYYRQQEGQTLGALDDHRQVIEDNIDAVIPNPPQRILSYEPEAIPKLLRFMLDNHSGCFHYELYYNLDESVKSLGLFPPEGDKGQGLRFVMSQLGIARSNVMAIGDNPNDLPMFNYARFRIAMGNGVQAVKDKATDIAPTYDDAGVAWAVCKYVLGNGQD